MSGATLTGEPVTVSGVGDLAAGHGQFRLETADRDPARAAVVEAWLEVGDERTPLDPATVLDLDDDAVHEPAGFDVRPGTMSFLLAFRRVSQPAGPAKPVSVCLRLDVGGTTLEARSPITFERRIPRR